MADAFPQKWRTNHSTYLIADRWITLRADSCITPEGNIIEPYYVFEYSDWVNCLVIDRHDNVILVHHYRHGINDYVTELVSGMLEADASPEEGTQRELEEEIGYTGGELFNIGFSYPNPSSHTNRVYSFLAMGGECCLPLQHEKGESLTVRKIPLQEFRQIITDPNGGKIYQSMHLATIFLVLHYLKNSSNPNLQRLHSYLI